MDCRDFRQPGSDSFEFGATLGSKRIPERDLKDNASFWDMLQRAVGRKQIMDITRVEFGAQTGSAEKKFIVGIPCEKQPEMAYSGFSMRQGENLSLTWRNAVGCTKAYVCLLYSAVCGIKDDSISKLD